MTTQSSAAPDQSAGSANPGALDSATLAGFKSAYASEPAHQLMQNVVTQHDVNDVALDRTIVTEAVNSFSTVLDDWGVTNQARSGRCWMFAGLNLFRAETRNLLNVREFEFSQNYLMFWDKMERANYILEAIIETADRPVDDRVVAWLLHQPLGDGGQWDMFVSLVRKHGVVPKSVMPETESSGNSMRMNAGLNYQVRQGARDIRRIYAEEGGLDTMRESQAGSPPLHLSDPLHPLGQPAGQLRLAMEGQGRRVLPRRCHDAPGVRRKVHRHSHGRVCLPGPRPPQGQPARPHLHRPVPRQRGRRHSHQVPQRRHRA